MISFSKNESQKCWNLTTKMKSQQIIQATNNTVLRHKEPTGFWEVFAQEILEKLAKT